MRVLEFAFEPFLHKAHNLSVPYKKIHIQLIFFATANFNHSGVLILIDYIFGVKSFTTRIYYYYTYVLMYCLLFVLYFNQYCSRSTSLSKDSTPGISRKSIRRETRYFMHTDGRIKADSRLAQTVRQHAYLLIGYNDEVIGERAG